MENKQVESETNKITNNTTFNNKCNENDLEFLKQLGDIAREFQKQYNTLQQEEREGYCQRKK